MRHFLAALNAGLVWSLVTLSLSATQAQAVADRPIGAGSPATSEPSTTIGHTTQPPVVPPPGGSRFLTRLDGRPWLVAFIGFRDIFDLGKWIYGAIGSRTGNEQLSNINDLERKQAEARAELEQLRSRAAEQQQELRAAEARLADAESRLAAEKERAAAVLRTATSLGYVTFMLGLSVVLQLIFSLWAYGARRFAEGRLSATQEALDDARKRSDTILGEVLQMALSQSRPLEFRRSLADELREGKRLQEGDVVALFAPLLNALEEIHSQNQVCRNITPETVLLPAGGDSCAFGGLQRHEPEADQGPWTDIRALGQTMCQALTGVDAHDGRLEPQRDSGFEPLSRVSPTLKRGIEAALSADATVGPRNVGEWRRMLPSLGEVKPIDGKPDQPTAVVTPQGAAAWRGFGIEQEASTGTRPADFSPWRPLSRYRVVGATMLLTVAATFMPDGPSRPLGGDGLGGPEQPRDSAFGTVAETGVVVGGEKGGIVPERGGRAAEEPESEAALGRSITDDPSIEEVAEYLRKWPDGDHMEAARGLEVADCKRCPHLVVVRLRPFEMGQEERRQEVNLQGLLAVGRYEVTLQQWRECVNAKECEPLDTDKIHDDRPNAPVMGVSWKDTEDYVGWLSELTGEKYRLLSEAEWEYVARGGTSEPWFWVAAKGELCEYANGSGCGGRKEWVPKKPRKPNAFGLYDMLGNVREWTSDCWRADGETGQPGDCEGKERVLRGGAWHDGLDDLRVTKRFHEPEGDRDDRGRFAGYDAGFRVAREIAGGGEPSQ